MNPASQRRRFLQQVIGLAAVSAPAGTAFAQGKVTRSGGIRVKLGLNAYSFNKPLMDRSMTLADVVDYCAQHGIDGLDATGYYFPGYPRVPTDEYIYGLKRRAFVNGVMITGTGVRNDFTLPDAARRKSDVQMVKDWIEVAAKLGAPVIRVFSGPKMAAGYTFDQTLELMIPDFKECAAHGKRFGVIVGLQNHDDFLDRRRNHSRDRLREFRVVRQHPRCRQPAHERPLHRDRKASSLRRQLATEGEGRLRRQRGSHRPAKNQGHHR